MLLLLLARASEEFTQLHQLLLLIPLEELTFKFTTQLFTLLLLFLPRSTKLPNKNKVNWIQPETELTQLKTLTTTLKETLEPKLKFQSIFN